ncbi:MAG: hypothetical protein ACP5HQ_01250 [Thermoprotei archaeon]
MKVYGDLSALDGLTAGVPSGQGLHLLGLKRGGGDILTSTVRLLNSMMGVTAPVFSHIMSIDARLSTEVTVMSKGKVMWQGGKVMAREDEPLGSVGAGLIEDAREAD